MGMYPIPRSIASGTEALGQASKNGTSGTVPSGPELNWMPIDQRKYIKNEGDISDNIYKR